MIDPLGCDSKQLKFRSDGHAILLQEKAHIIILEGLELWSLCYNQEIIHNKLMHILLQLLETKLSGEVEDPNAVLNSQDRR